MAEGRRNYEYADDCAESVRLQPQLIAGGKASGVFHRGDAQMFAFVFASTAAAFQNIAAKDDGGATPNATRRNPYDLVDAACRRN